MSKVRWAPGLSPAAKEAAGVAECEIVVDYCFALRRWVVMRGQVVVAQCDDRWEAQGRARRLCDES